VLPDPGGGRCCCACTRIRDARVAGSAGGNRLAAGSLTGCNTAAEFDKTMLLMRPVAALVTEGCVAAMPPPGGTSNMLPLPTLLKCTKDDRPPFWA
jgi:hypothetical protein